jgi:DNA polymerase III delta prime subunit
MYAVTVVSAVMFVIFSQQINILCHLIHHVIGFMFSTLCCINLQTTSVHALARQLLGSAYSNGVLELNASDSRGIDVSGSINIRVACVFAILSFQYISYRSVRSFLPPPLLPSAKIVGC